MRPLLARPKAVPRVAYRAVLDQLTEAGLGREVRAAEAEGRLGGLAAAHDEQGDCKGEAHGWISGWARPRPLAPDCIADPATGLNPVAGGCSVHARR